MHTLKRLLILPVLLTCPQFILAAPNTSVSAQLHGEHITWDHTGSSVKTKLNVTNHEAYSVICDAEMKTSYDEKIKKEEVTIPPGKTTTFPFRHNKSVTKLQLFLICQADAAEKAKVKETGRIEGSGSEQTTDNIVTRKLEQEAPKEVKVPVEELGQF
jgi:hypothetical protein